MNKVAEFLKDWALVIFLCALALMVLFTVGCTIYTAIINPFAGIVGLVGAMASLAIIGWLIYKEIERIKWAQPKQ